jgi:PAS domain S-box-containing protein
MKQTGAGLLAREGPGARRSFQGSVSKPSSEARLKLSSEVFNRLPLGVVILRLEDAKDATSFRIIDLNPAAAHIARATPDSLGGRTLAEFPKLLETSLPGQCLDTLRACEPRDLGEASWDDGQLGQLFFSVKAFPLSGDCLGVVFEDVTDRRLAEQAVRQSADRLRSLIEGVQAYAMFQLDPLGHVVTWNAGAERVKGYRAEEIIGKHFSVFYPREDAMQGMPERALKEAAERGQSQNEGWRIRKDGSRFWASVVVTALRDSQGKLQGFAKLTQDMTGRHEKERTLTKEKERLELRVEQRTAVLARTNKELRSEIAERKRIEEQHKISLQQLRALAARLQSVREEERTLIAREIHDELGQACTAIKMDLALIGRKATKRQDRLRAKVASAIQLVDNMIGSLRRIAFELRPRMLDNLGLAAAMEWQAQEFESRTGIRCSIRLPREGIALDAERSTAIFRIFQESLTNVVRHAQATRVQARLETSANQLVFQVHDNGRGFDLDEAWARRSLGLVGMRERAVLLNGEFQVEGAPGRGTTLTLRIPLPQATVPNNKQDENPDC